jgi:hypothetical protein
MSHPIGMALVFSDVSMSTTDCVLTLITPLHESGSVNDPFEEQGMFGISERHVLMFGVAPAAA